MHEYKIILPLADNDGKDLAAIHKRLARSLSSAFGGCTQTQGHGNWIGPHGHLVSEPVMVFIAAANGSGRTDATIRFLAHRAARQASQHSVYYSTTGGIQIDTVQPNREEIAA